MCDLQVGDEVTLTGPRGKRFVLPANPSQHDYVFIATGTGIAPFRAMMMDLAQRAPASQVTLVIGVAYHSDLLYHEQLSDLAGQRDSWSYLTSISRESQEDGAGPMYVHERLLANGEQLAPLLGSERTLVYISGIAGMELGVFRALSKILDQQRLSGLLEIDPELAGEDHSWTRRMIHRQIRPTRRVFLEVYA